MEVILKTLHYFLILFAGGVTVGSGVIQAAYMKAGEAPPPYIGKAFALLGYIGLGSIVTLWITGIGLAHLIYGGLAINGAFHAKLLGAAIVLFISAYANLHVYCLLYTSPSPRDGLLSRMPSSA